MDIAAPRDETPEDPRPPIRKSVTTNSSQKPTVTMPVREQAESAAVPPVEDDDEDDEMMLDEGKGSKITKSVANSVFFFTAFCEILSTVDICAEFVK
jgi:hypothetical protein